jgi:CRISPR/Cas system-associated exonuclease Cas4 (RecB family)
VIFFVIILNLLPFHIVFIFMTSLPFLKEIAAFLLRPGEYNLSETCVVFPNKRARLYLSKYMGELTDKPVWAPRYTTINELMENLSGYTYADKLTILFELFEIYRQETRSDENFENFYTYADPLLADFDEIDKYLADARDLFSNLAGLKALEGKFSYLSEEQIAAIRQFWNTFDPDHSSEGQKTFISLWNVLEVMYSRLRQNLSSKGLAYEGMAYRKVAEDIMGNGDMDGLNAERYLFVGFNALNKCEERLFRYLKNKGKAEFYWDYDTWYEQNEIHEAGLFLRKNLKDFPPTRPVNHENIASGNKNIYFLPVPSNTGQAEALPYVFEKLGIQQTSENQHTALVLADENLLIPVLYAIPESVTNLNITMGYPILGSVVFNLVDSLYELGRNKRSDPQRGPTYYYKDVLSILGNPLLKTIYGGHIRRVRDLITKSNLVYLSGEEILDDKNEDILFSRVTSTINACHYLANVFEFLIRRLADPENEIKTDPVQMEILFQVYTYLTRLKDILANYTFEPGFETLFRLIRRMLKTLHIPFNGEPLAGLQLLGILETRTLDFDNVIILSMNEGVLPRSSAIPSFIPQNLRFGFGLPTPDHQDSIYAYYFYRLIQRASNVVLVYDSSTGGLRTGERSRFMHQLYYELPGAVNEVNPSFPVTLLRPAPIIVEKKGEVADALMLYTDSGRKILSPSALNEFLNCSLRFYFHHIAGLPQPEEVTEDIDARIFGNLLHKAMQILYGGFGSSLITKEQLEAFLKKGDLLNDALDRSFHEVLFGSGEGSSSRKIEGFNLIVRQIIRSYIYNLLTADAGGGAFSIADLEKHVETVMSVETHDRVLSVRIGGTIDRIDLFEGHFRIIDYKTGMVKNTFNTVSSLFDSTEKLRNDAVFQVLLYAMIYQKLVPESNIVPALCFVRSSHADTFSYSIQYGEKKKKLEDYGEVKIEFEELIRFHLARLFNLDEPFTHTENDKICQNCPYAVICRKEGR